MEYIYTIHYSYKWSEGEIYTYKVRGIMEMNDKLLYMLDDGRIIHNITRRHI